MNFYLAENAYFDKLMQVENHSFVWSFFIPNIMIFYFVYLNLYVMQKIILFELWITDDKEQ